MRSLALAAGLTVGLTLTSGIAFAWTGPTGSPPSNNTSAPVNVGAVTQDKNGTLGVNGLAVFGNTLLGGSSGSNAYLNFGGTSGSSGYGIWDSNGTIEFKNSGGSWASLQNTIYTLEGSSTNPWQTNGSNIYYSGGNVGINATNPSYPLTVAGGQRGNWAAVIDWPPSNSNQYGLLVGSSADGYSQFENASNYYTILTNTSWGVETNGNVWAQDYYDNASGQWLSNAAYADGGQFWTGYGSEENCPGGALEVGVSLSSGLSSPSAESDDNVAVLCQWIN